MKAVRNSTKAHDLSTAAGYAEFYFDGLMSDPQSVKLSGILDDVRTTKPAGDEARSMMQFADALQARFSGSSESPVITCIGLRRRISAPSSKNSRRLKLRCASSMTRAG